MKKEDFNKIMLDWEVPVAKSKAEAWQNLMTKIDQPATQETKIVSLKRKLAVIVAVAAVALLGALYFIPSGNTEIHFANKQSNPVILPDGSKIWANANSNITFNKNSWKENREVTLEGEAYFEVEKGSQFTVKTPHGEVAVLGTSFNVLDKHNFFEVECYTGKVAVTSNEKQKILTPGKATRLAGNQLKTIYNIQELKSDWIHGKFRFENQSLKRVFDELSDTYGITCQLNYSGEKFFTGNFEIEDLETSLKTICLPMDLHFTINGKQVVISE